MKLTVTISDELAALLPDEGLDSFVEEALLCRLGELSDRGRARLEKIVTEADPEALTRARARVDALLDEASDQNPQA